MNESETIRILGQIKAAWPKQTVDDAVVAVWTQALGSVPYQHGQVAVVEFINTERVDPPTPGQVREAGMRVWDRHEQRKRAAMRQLPEPQRKPEEIQTVKQMLDEFFARHGGRPVLQPDGTWRRAAADVVGAVANRMDMNARLKREPGEEG